ncbi:MAG: PorV/PorQ family protein [Bacteroidales bacterium]|nr:PorV/PorQ family protein [Bacteroidales bacterium]MDD3664587.1 PorV/PorQ family protein [Bacteroidales bacterium]
MKNIYKYLIAIAITGLTVFPGHNLMAGNKDRSGQAGVYELLINPWAASSGWGGVNIASVRGLEGIYNNVAGIAHTKTTELIFSHTQYLKNSDINIVAFGFTQRVGESGVLGMTITSMSAGEIMITTPTLPEGGIGTFSPSLMNVALSYAKSFSNSITGGLTLRMISESISDLSANGVALDAGIQYVTGEDENIKFGITLKNIGPRLAFSGDGLTNHAWLTDEDDKFSVSQRESQFELPATLSIGAAYDFLFERSRFTLAGSFQSHSFNNDQYRIGGEFSFRNYVVLRAGYTYEDGQTNDIYSGERYTLDNGLSGGLSVQVPMNKEKGSLFAVDYSYRSTEHFDGTHSIGVRITL